MKRNRRKDFEDLIGSKAEPLPLEMIASELALLFGTTHRTISVLADRGILPKLPNGKFETIESVRRYLAFGRKGGNAELETEKVRLTREQADKIEIGNAKTRGELIPISDVEHQWAAILKDLRRAMLALPSRVHSRLPHLTQHDVSELDHEIRNALEALAHE